MITLEKVRKHLKKMEEQLEGGFYMTEFKLCEEMGLERWGTYLLDDNKMETVIKASDVEKMLQCGQAGFAEFQWNFSNSNGDPMPEKPSVFSTILLTIPKKPKPVTKEEIITMLKAIRANPVSFEFNPVTDLLKRIEKAGIE